MTALPNNLELQKLVSAGLTQPEIAEMFHVSQQAVSYRMTGLGTYAKGSSAPITAAMPWDLTTRADKYRLTNQAAYRGLRYFVGWRMGDPKKLSDRAKKDLRLFLAKVEDGYVLTLDETSGFTYVVREESDGPLVVRWPAEAPREGEKLALFSLPPGKLPSL